MPAGVLSYLPCWRGFAGGRWSTTVLSGRTAPEYLASSPDLEGCSLGALGPQRRLQNAVRSATTALRTGAIGHPCSLARRRAGSRQRADGLRLQSGTMTGLFRGLGFTGADGGSRQHLAKTTAHGRPYPERCPPPTASQRAEPANNREHCAHTGRTSICEHGYVGPGRSTAGRDLSKRPAPQE